MLIELTKFGEPMLVNTDYIVHVRRMEGGSELLLANGHLLEVEETPERVEIEWLYRVSLGDQALSRAG